MADPTPVTDTAASNQTAFSAGSDALLKSFYEDYREGRLPPEIQARMDDARDVLVDKWQADVKDTSGQLTDWVADFRSTAIDAAADLLAQHPEMRSLAELNAEDNPAEAMVAMRETLHKAIDGSQILDDLVTNVVQDAVDTTREVLVIRSDADETGALTAQIATANAELDVAEARLHSDMDRSAERRDQAHQELDEIVDVAEDHPEQFNAVMHQQRDLTGEVNRVEFDGSETGAPETA